MTNTPVTDLERAAYLLSSEPEVIAFDETSKDLPEKSYPCAQSFFASYIDLIDTFLVSGSF